MGMPDILASAFAAIQTINGIEATYYRSEQFVNLTIIPGRTLATVNDVEGISTKTRVNDFLIKQSELVIGDVETIPLKGDKIITTSGMVFEVLPFGAEPEYRAADPYNVWLRVHVKQVDNGVYMNLGDGSFLELDDGTFLVLE